MNASISGNSFRMSSHSPVRWYSARRRVRAVSKIRWKRTWISYSTPSRGSRVNSASRFARSSGDTSSGRRRNSHIRARNSLRSAFDSFALYARVIFFPLPVHGLVELLGDVEAVHHAAGVRQLVPAGVVERLAHVGPVGLHLPPLRLP